MTTNQTTTNVYAPAELDLDADTLIREGRFQLVTASSVRSGSLLIMSAKVFRVTSVRHDEARSNTTTLNLRRAGQRYSMVLAPTEDVVLVHHG